MKHLAVTHPPTLGAPLDRLDRLSSPSFRLLSTNLDFDLGKKIHNVLNAAIQFRTIVLVTMALSFATYS